MVLNYLIGFLMAVAKILKYVIYLQGFQAYHSPGARPLNLMPQSVSVSSVCWFKFLTKLVYQECFTSEVYSNDCDYRMLLIMAKTRPPIKEAVESTLGR
ncbi:hypothetical protein C5167_031430 [Papaver somniferum]|uniref:Uncharacterized protein n=1 Tax=Papaver somniferum TaxID=3469 RepID=A0A4Y7K5J1_PAPSO|nr:hypothetical protein C5167_031430 [Papaver somniferum]